MKDFYKQKKRYFGSVPQYISNPELEKQKWPKYTKSRETN